MRIDLRIVGATLALLALGSTGVGADEKLVLRVTPHVSSAPGIVNVRAIVRKHPSNRHLEISADSGGFFRSSLIELDGDRAPLVTEVALKNLPGGEYTVVATLRDNRGRRTVVSRSVVVLSRLGDLP